MRPALCLALLMLATACSRVPEAESAEGDGARNGGWPTIAPLGAILDAADDPGRAPAAEAELTARAAALRARAAAIRQAAP
ncbi:hypothetical protein [Ruixingdingia sedimenti]|uniref:Uncharacterized protein n=1 Tax=Ruixingdingia sedimenti TaxID=3073604 RepID=A0ABU1F5X3_9RHOB|nr:hypothetical protein [Xinfangfangia sp. LG-4]MDR5652043.1 hypothetical protein [Xinfangfangia sp. LG-4]